jgi:hypothetical protein
VDASSCIAFDIFVKGDDFGADMHCVQNYQTGTLFLELVLHLGESAASHSRACSQLAMSLCSLAEELECPTIHLCVRKGQRGYAAWVRACLYVGFALTPKVKASRVLRSGAKMVVLKLQVDDEGKDLSDDQSVSTTDESDYSMPSPSSVCSFPSAFGFLELAA